MINTIYYTFSSSLAQLKPGYSHIYNSNNNDFPRLRPYKVNTRKKYNLHKNHVTNHTEIIRLINDWKNITNTALQYQNMIVG